MAPPLAPVVYGPIYAISQATVHVDNLLPNSTVIIYANGPPLTGPTKVGEANSATQNELWVPLTRALNANQTVTATQTYNGAASNAYQITPGVASDASPAVPVISVPGSLPAPLFMSGLSTCMDSVRMGNLIQGCTLHVTVTVSGQTHTLVDKTVVQPTQSFTLASIPIPLNATLEAFQTYEKEPRSPTARSLPVSAPPSVLAAPVVNPP